MALSACLVGQQAHHRTQSTGRGRANINRPFVVHLRTLKIGATIGSPTGPKAEIVTNP